MEHLHLKIADFNINIYMEEAEGFPNLAKEYKNKIFSLLKGFVTSQSERVDFKLRIVYKNSFYAMVNVNSKKHYVGFYEEFPIKNSFMTYYYISNEQLLIIIRDIVQKLIVDSGVIMHGSATKIDGDAILFMGDSGAGKSTIVKMLSPDFEALADDIFIIREVKKNYYFYQTPFMEKNTPKNKEKLEVPLKKIFFLKKGLKEKRRLLVDRGEVFHRLLKQVFVNTKDVKKQINFLLKLSLRFKDTYLLEFTKENPDKLIVVINE